METSFSDILIGNLVTEMKLNLILKIARDIVIVIVIVIDIVIVIVIQI